MESSTDVKLACLQKRLHIPGLDNIYWITVGAAYYDHG